MTIRQLRTLIAVADAKTFSAAAEAVHITHAAVSQQMQNLEADLGVTLFDRTPRSPVLTPVARQIVAKSRLLLADYDNLVPSVLDGGGLRGVLTLGVMRTTLTGLIPTAVATLKSNYPDLGLHIRPGLTMALLSEIKRGQLDTAVISKPFQLTSGVVFQDIAEEPMHLVAGSDETSSDPLELLLTRPFIRFDRNAVVGALIDNWLLAKGIPVSETMELDSPEAIESMVQAGLGVSILPDLTVQPQERPAVRRISLGPDAPSRTLGLVCLDKNPKTQAIDALYKALTDTIKEAG